MRNSTIIIIGEDHEGRCLTCGAQTFLTVARCWAVDTEGEAERRGLEEDEIPQALEIDDEVSAHICEKCNQITALFFHAARRKEPS